MEKKVLNMYQATNLFNNGYVPEIANKGFKLFNPNNYMFGAIDEDTFMHFSKELSVKEKTFVVSDTQAIYNLIQDGWKLCDKGLTKGTVTINIEFGK